MGDPVEEYRQLLDDEAEEQAYQNFLENNTKFIPRHFVQNHGVHMNLAIRKLKLSNDMITDFVILSKSSISWSYILIEIEKPSSRFFKPGSIDVHSDFVSGVKQIKTWQSWFSKPGNKEHFEAQLRFLKKPISNTPVEIKYILVSGRRREFEGSEDKIHTIRSYESHDFKIMSFDSLAENAMKNEELYLGVRKQGAVLIKSQKLLDMTFLHWCNESDFILNEGIKNLFLTQLTRKKKKKTNAGALGKLAAKNTDDIIRKVGNMRVST